MSQPAFAALAPLPFELVYSDGVPLDSEWHGLQQSFLRTLIRQLMAEQGRTDFFTGKNMFVYYSVEQARKVWEEETKERPRTAFRGPDVFWVGDVEDYERKAWVSWEEGGRLPDVIIELLSPSTERNDRKKKTLYAEVFHTAEYFLCKPHKGVVEGFRLVDGAYRPIPPDEKGRVWSGPLGAFLGLWNGVYDGRERVWARLFRPDGTLVPTETEAEHERAEAERQKAEAERQRADAAEAELARLRTLLEERDRG